MTTTSGRPAAGPSVSADGPAALSDATLRLAADDEVVVAIRDLAAGTVLDAPGGAVIVQDDIPRGHKLATRAIKSGEPVHKYGQPIGRASTDIAPGQHVHVHNLGMDLGPSAHELATVHTELTPPDPIPTFLGYRRANGKVGTRNYIGILTSVNCSAATARMIAVQAQALLSQYPHVDGVIALTHTSGCGMIPESEGGGIFQRTLHGYAAHPNFTGLLVLGLGCEMIQVQSILDSLPTLSDTVVESLTIQATGGIRATVAAGLDAVRRMLPIADQRRREPVPASELVLGLNCGGSDGYSGITANPALGYASDLLVAAGGASVLAETPEVFGAEHLLTRRARTPEVAEALLDRIDWWQKYTHDGGGTLDNNPSPGNKAGGLTTILEKSLGAVAKAGRADLAAVYHYAEPIDVPGLGFMDTPGYDPVSVTGLVAGGATVICFTTGRGSVLGTLPAPTLKLATNTDMFEQMSEDMDINCGRITDGTVSVEQVGEEIFARILAVASGEATASEELGLGQDEFVPWHVGAVT